jgi:DNA polymerase III delta prime subunit
MRYALTEEEFSARIAAHNKEQAQHRSKPLNGQPVEHPTEPHVRLEDFVAYMPTHSYIYKVTGDHWPAASLNARIEPVKVGDKLIKASEWLDKHSAVEQMTWMPGEPQIIKDRLIAEGGMFPHIGASVFNLYHPPLAKPKPAEPTTEADVAMWLDHIRKIYPTAADHIVKYFAYKVQHPGDKINHGLVLAGPPGIGKDTILEALKEAVGRWNFIEISPTQVVLRFNGFSRAVVVRVSEARDLGDVDRFKFYEKCKIYMASPPDVLRVDEKNIKEYYVPNVMGFIITTNHSITGLYLPPDDRRHYVAASKVKKEAFPPDYWNMFWDWYRTGGLDAVGRYLAELDLSGFDPKAPPPQTDAFLNIVNASITPEDADMADALDRLERPDVVTIHQIRQVSDASFTDWLNERKNARQVSHRLDTCGYQMLRNPKAKDGNWKIAGKRQVIFMREELSFNEAMLAAKKVFDIG